MTLHLYDTNTDSPAPLRFILDQLGLTYTQTDDPQVLFPYSIPGDPASRTVIFPDGS